MSKDDSHTDTVRIGGRLVDVPATLCHRDARRVPHRRAFIAGGEDAANNYGLSHNPYRRVGGGVVYADRWDQGYQAFHVAPKATKKVRASA